MPPSPLPSAAVSLPLHDPPVSTAPTLFCLVCCLGILLILLVFQDRLLEVLTLLEKTEWNNHHNKNTHVHFTPPLHILWMVVLRKRSSLSKQGLQDSRDLAPFQILFQSLSLTSSLLPLLLLCVYFSVPRMPTDPFVEVTPDFHFQFCFFKEAFLPSHSQGTRSSTLETFYSPPQSSVFFIDLWNYFINKLPFICKLPENRNCILLLLYPPCPVDERHLINYLLKESEEGRRKVPQHVIISLRHTLE